MPVSSHLALSRLQIPLLLFLFFACDVPFTPKGEFRNFVAVYGILSDRTDTLFVRLYNTYNPEGLDPLQQTLDEPVLGAVVRISDGMTTTTLSETTVTRLDTTRFTGPISLYKAHPLPIRRAATYSLTIEMTDGRSSHAVQTTPDRGVVEITNPGIIANPTIGANILIRAVLSSPARGYRVRFFMEFEVLEGAQWISYLREIPRQVERLNTPLEAWHYHELTRRTFDGGQSQEVISFFNDAYRRGLSAIRTEFSGFQIRWVKAVFILAQVDLHLYNYYNVANAFRDPYSTRIDRPDYTNIEGGVGVFGSMMHDSAFFTFPPNTVF